MRSLKLTQLALENLEAMPIEDIALLVAKDHYPRLNLQHYEDRLDEFARQARHRIGGMVGGPTVARGLSQYLFQEEGFRANKQDYYNPSNSYFNDVLDQRTGIPITLSILYVAIGRRLQLPVSGVAFPGHFLVHYHEAGENFYIDPFNHGKLLSTDECKQRLSKQYGHAMPFRPEFLVPSTHREILVRLLTNLKINYLLKKEYETVVESLTKILLFTSEGAEELKERGLLYYHLECFTAAQQDLEQYLIKVPEAPDRHVLEQCLSDLKEKVSQIS